MSERSIPDQDTFEKELDRFFLATGRALREWAELEISLVFHFSWLVHTDQFRARVVWMSMPNLRARLQLMERLARTFVDEPALSKFITLLKRTRRLAGKRNLLAHAHGGYDPRRNIVQFLGDSEHKEFGIDFISGEEFQFENVKNWEKDIEKLRNDWFAVLHDVQEHSHRLSKIHRSQRHSQKHQFAPNQQEASPSEPGPRHQEHTQVVFPALKGSAKNWSFGYRGNER